MPNPFGSSLNETSFFWTDKIIVGSLGGVLRLYKSHIDAFSSNNQQPLLEVDLGLPILALASGRFLPSSDSLHLLILHPRKVCVYSLSGMPADCRPLLWCRRCDVIDIRPTEQARPDFLHMAVATTSSSSTSTFFSTAPTMSWLDLSVRQRVSSTKSCVYVFEISLLLKERTSFAFSRWMEPCYSSNRRYSHSDASFQITFFPVRWITAQQPIRSSSPHLRGQSNATDIKS